jgi:hypothetical protein
MKAGLPYVVAYVLVRRWEKRRRREREGREAA